MGRMRLSRVGYLAMVLTSYECAAQCASVPVRAGFPSVESSFLLLGLVHLGVSWGLQGRLA
jgi:hypothetical protein